MKPLMMSADSFEQVLKHYSNAGDKSFGESDQRQRCIELLSDAMHWMAGNIHQIFPVLEEAHDRFLQEARGNEDLEDVPDNFRRANRVEEVLTWYGTDDTQEGCLTDLLTDARHWCRVRGHVFSRIDATAGGHFEMEVIEERPITCMPSDKALPGSGVGLTEEIGGGAPAEPFDRNRTAATPEQKGGIGKDMPFSFAADVEASLMARAEGIADHFERIASTPEQVALARGLSDFVSGELYTCIHHLSYWANEADKMNLARPVPSPSDVIDNPRKYLAPEQAAGSGKERDREP